jgi:altronate hydrolase
MNPAIVIAERDNVATALEPLAVGRVLEIAGAAIAVTEAIPRGHKVALRLIRAGEPVLKYGSAIGTATATIPAGTHVHTHNLASARGRGDLHAETLAADPRIAEPPDRSPVTGAEPSPDGRMSD